MARLLVDTDLPLGNGTISCDIFVLSPDYAGDMVCSLASSSPDIYLLHSPSLHMNTVRAVNVDHLMWATYIKSSHISHHCSTRHGSSIESIQRFLADPCVLHKSAVSVHNVENLVNATSFEAVSDGVTRLRFGDTAIAGPIAASWVIDESTCLSDEMICLPVPHPVHEQDTINTTYVLVGNKFAALFQGTARVETLNDLTLSLKPDGMAIPQGECASYIYLSPLPMKLTCGICSYYHKLPLSVSEYAERFDGRTYVSANGTKAKDNTRLRLMTFTEHCFRTVPLLCGCAIRDGVSYCRAHVPITLIPDRGMFYSFEDCAVSVIMIVDGMPKLCVDPLNRHRFGEVWWVEGRKI
jgi:hypothetical protein